MLEYLDQMIMMIRRNKVITNLLAGFRCGLSWCTQMEIDLDLNW